MSSKCSSCPNQKPSCGSCNSGSSRRNRGKTSVGAISCQKKECAPGRCPVECPRDPPKRSDCDPCTPHNYNTVWLTNFGDDFSLGDKKSDAYTFLKFQDTGYTTNSANIRNNSEGLIMNSQVFQNFVLDENDNPVTFPNAYADQECFEAAIVVNSQFSLPECGELYSEVCMAAEQRFDAGITDQKEVGTLNAFATLNGAAVEPELPSVLNSSLPADPSTETRLAHGGHFLLDPVNNYFALIALCNTYVVLHWGSLAYGRKDAGGVRDYLVANGTKRIAVRENGGVDASCDFITTGLGWNKSTKTITAYVNGKSVFTFPISNRQVDPQYATRHISGDFTCCPFETEYVLSGIVNGSFIDQKYGGDGERSIGANATPPVDEGGDACGNYVRSGLYNAPLQAVTPLTNVCDTHRDPGYHTEQAVTYQFTTVEDSNISASTDRKGFQGVVSIAKKHLIQHRC